MGQQLVTRRCTYLQVEYCTAIHLTNTHVLLLRLAADVVDFGKRRVRSNRIRTKSCACEVPIKRSPEHALDGFRTPWVLGNPQSMCLKFHLTAKPAVGRFRGYLTNCTVRIPTSSHPEMDGVIVLGVVGINERELADLPLFMAPQRNPVFLCSAMIYLGRPVLVYPSHCVSFSTPFPDSDFHQPPLLLPSLYSCSTQSPSLYASPYHIFLDRLGPWSEGH